jgi:hypothetical protein
LGLDGPTGGKPPESLSGAFSSESLIRHVGVNNASVGMIEQRTRCVIGRVKQWAVCARIMNLFLYDIQMALLNKTAPNNGLVKLAEK